MAAPVPWVSCPRTVLLVEPERGGAAAGVPAVPHLPGAVGHPGVHSPTHSPGGSWGGAESVLQVLPVESTDPQTG